MNKILIIVAMEAELGMVRALLSNPEYNNLYIKGQLGNKTIIIMKSGIGKVNAAVRLTEIIYMEHPDMVINTGVAGGIGFNIKQGDIVFGVEYAYHDVWCGEGEYGQVQGMPRFFTAGQKLLTAARTLKNERLRYGQIVSGDQFIDSENQMKIIKNMFPGAAAVDMESAAFAQVCYIYKIEFLAARLISDAPGSGDNIKQYNNFIKRDTGQLFNILYDLLNTL